MSTLSLDTAAQLYNPSFDPLVDQGVGQAMAYAPTYWVASAGTPPENDGAITHDLDADVVIVGGGFTGLATALFLAREHGIKATLLEANQTAWGCTSRNGGQGQNASGRLYRSQWINRWGIDIAKRLDAEIHGGFETFKSLVSEIDCDAQDYGHLYVAHRDKKMAFLENEAKVMRDIFGYQTRILDRMQLQEEFCHDQEACGALYEPEGVGVHPLKLAYGYQRLARSLGVKIHTGSPVIAWSQRNGKHCLETPGGKVHAKVVGLATGAYGGQFLTPHLRNRVMPILSNSMVTRVLTDVELAEISVKKPAFITDTRTLRFYYRLLPDRRMQIGSRSAIHGANATAPKHL
ncbi:MAG: NAD(P)/FAD-dependent oxidoreductase, partial [Polynucleobacter sp.]